MGIQPTLGAGPRRDRTVSQGYRTPSWEQSDPRALYFRSSGLSSCPRSKSRSFQQASSKPRSVPNALNLIHLLTQLPPWPGTGTFTKLKIAWIAIPSPRIPPEKAASEFSRHMHRPPSQTTDSHPAILSSALIHHHHSRTPWPNALTSLLSFQFATAQMTANTQLGGCSPSTGQVTPDEAV